MHQSTTHRSRPQLSPLALAVVLASLLLSNAPVAFGQFTFTDINPSWSNLDASDVNGGTGGRVNGLAVKWADPTTYYAASEWGGIYKSTDSGLTWFRLDGHNPNATWDVEVNPANVNRVYATSLYDGRVDSIAGINISIDGGATWSHPASAVPPAGLCNTAAAQSEPAAFGISIDPEEPQIVHIGTNCGIATSTDAGGTWTYRSTLTGFLAGEIIDVVAHHDGFVDVCGYFGHQRSTDYGVTWAGLDGDIPGGTCSIAASPDDPDVLFVTVGTDIYESADGGVTWTNLGTPDQARQGRIPFVAVNDRTGDAFDLWFGDIRLYRGSCTSNPDPGQPHCPQASLADDPPDTPPTGWEWAIQGGHWDVGDIVFNSGATVDACPTIFSSDGGVYWNTKSGDGCHSPAWEQPNVTPHGLWLWTLSGADYPDPATEGLYFGCQDVGTFGTMVGGATPVPWNNNDCCDSFDFASDAASVLYTLCCYSPGRANRLFVATPALAIASEIAAYPEDGLIPGFRFPDILDQYGDNLYVLITRDCTPGQRGCPGGDSGDGGIYAGFVSSGFTAWLPIGDATEPPTGGDSPACAVKASVGAATTFYVQSGSCDGRGNDVLWRWAGSDTVNDPWEQVNLPAGGISLFDVDPGNPDRLIAVNLPPGNDPQIILSNNGGASWDHLPQLDTLMTGYGDYHYTNSLGATSSTRYLGYPQPSLVAFDPADPNILVAGARDAGVFLSTDGGDDWLLVTNPDSTGGPIPHLPQAWFAYFDHEPAGWVSMYVGTRGRGVWRVAFEQPPAADADGPYTTDEGTDVALDGTGSTAPAGHTLTYEWDFDGDLVYDDATGPTPTFNLVGRDGVFTVRLRVTDDTTGLTDVDLTTVTVNNVAPTVSFDPQDPEDEGAPLLVTGTISDPGWLDPLSATIDWGDGSPTEDAGGILENVRPDATLSFSVSHCYGDNGSYTVEVCGSDDDTAVCESASVTINNVPPAVAIDGGQVTEIDEGQTIDVLAHFSDPGWLDTYSSTIDWGYGGWMDPGTLAITGPGGESCPDPDIGTVTGSKQYGDNDDGGGFTITVTVADDDLGLGMAAFSLTVNNIDPTAEIDETDAVDVCGAPTFIVHAGEEAAFSARSTDPGSDDLFLSWDWDDGPPAPDVTTDYLVGVPVPGVGDPLPSPEVSPRDVTDLKTHIFEDACYYNVRFLADDDDDGHGEDDTDVLIVGNAELIRSAGYWYNQFRKTKFFTTDELNCYLDIVNHVSSVFSEITDADSIEDAKEVMDPAHSDGDIRVQFDRQLLALWLNFANGAVEHDELVDTDFDNLPDTPLLDVLCAAEAARLDPTTSDAVLEDWKDVLELINLSDET
jgi:photosystem II stability/assembly factor-like uncharacterized protein